jgi:hypothetical protein
MTVVTNPIQSPMLSLLLSLLLSTKERALATETTTIRGVSDLPFIDYAHNVEFHFLATSFPYNTDQSMTNLLAGIISGTELTALHTGLGVWDTSTDTKFSIQFVPKDYLNTLLPSVSDGNIVWDNSGFIAVTSPLVEGNWKESRLVATTSGC